MSKVDEIDKSLFMTSAQIFTSFGDMTRLGHFESFRPSSQHDTLVVDDIDFTIRCKLPGTAFALFEYDGYFRVKTLNGRQFASVEDINLQASIVKELFNTLI